MPSTYTTRDGVTLSRDAFVGHYVAAWLAASAVHRYWSGYAGDSYLNQPIEDALCCAESAWEQLETIKP